MSQTKGWEALNFIDHTPTAGIVVGKNSAIVTGRDFTGKTVGVTGLLNIGQVTTEQWIDKNGGDSSTGSRTLGERALGRVGKNP